jgi:hypothetical protein
VIYNFLSLCYEYLGGEGNIMSEIRDLALFTNVNWPLFWLKSYQVMRRKCILIEVILRK